MDRNLEADYDALRDFLGKYQRFAVAFLARFTRISMRKPWRALSIVAQTFRRDPLSLRAPKARRDLFDSIATASERESPFFAIVASEYVLDALAVELLRTFPDFDFASLLELHRIRLRQINRLGPVTIIGAILGISAAVLHSVPESVVQPVFGMSPAEWDLRVFWITVFVGGYVMLVFVPVWIMVGVRMLRYAMISNVLEYTCLKRKPNRSFSATTTPPNAN